MSSRAARPRHSDFIELLLELDPADRAAWLATLTRAQRLKLRYAWRLIARPDQWWEPGPETYTVAMAGRGWGKNTMGAHTTNRVARNPKWCAGWIGIAGRTWGDLYGTMVDGDVGIRALAPPGFMPTLNVRKRLLIWPNGVRARLFSGEDPESFRGPNIGWGWADELAYWSRLAGTPGKPGAWANFKMTLRKGDHPRALVTMTPLALPEIEALIWEHTDGGEPQVALEGDPIDRILDGFRIAPGTRVIVGSTYDNEANLSPAFLRDTVQPLERSPQADQELRAKIMRGNPHSPFRLTWIRRVEAIPADEVLCGIAVVVDPSGKANGTGSEVGIVVMAQSTRGIVYLLADLSGDYTGPEWAAVVAGALIEWNATTIVVEDNLGGDMVEVTVRSEMPEGLDALAMIVRVTAHVSKAKRASLAAPLWGAGKCYHVGPPAQFVQLEGQMRAFDPRKPARGQATDRMDAVVWGALHFDGDGTDATAVRSLSDVEAMELIHQGIAERLGARE
jgi:phage terminase large subunit-like protein